MKKIIAFVLVLLFLTPSAVLADGMIIPPPDQNVTQAEQRALIVYQNGKEDLLISLEFRGDAQEFAWFLPVPAKPEIKEAEDEIFTKLGELTRPKENLLERLKGERGLYPVPLLGEVGRGVPAEKKIEVIETKRVGILDVTVLQAEKASDLEEWLKENGYQIPEEERRSTVNRTRQIFQEYLDKDWYFVAAKIATEFLQEFPRPTPIPISPPPIMPLPQEGGKALGIEEEKVEKSYYPRPPQYLGNAHITPLHLTFDTDKIVYPMKITSLNSSSPNVLLYVLADHKKTVSNYRYQYVRQRGEEDNYIFKTKYAAQVKADELQEWLPEVKNGYLTKLYASYISPAQMKEDLRFENAKDNKTVGTGRMRIKDWLILPFYLSIYGPIRILEWFVSRPINYYQPVSRFIPIIPLILVGFLGGIGLLWVVIFYFLLSRTRGRLKRAILYLLQFPGVWVLVNLLSLIFVIPCLVVMLLLKVEAGVVIFNLLIKNNLGAVFFTAIFYALQAKLHRFK